jgi:hypothetical protein
MLVGKPCSQVRGELQGRADAFLVSGVEHALNRKPAAREIKIVLRRLLTGFKRERLKLFSASGVAV